MIHTICLQLSNGISLFSEQFQVWNKGFVKIGNNTPEMIETINKSLCM